MKRLGTSKTVILLLACLAMAVPGPAPQAAVAAESPHTPATPATPAANDVALHPGGLLLGQVVDANGRPLVGVPVTLRRLDRPIATAVTDQAGNFTVPDLRTGEYEVVAGAAFSRYRLWSPGAAPLSAQPGVLIVVADRQVRGQQGPITYWLSKPWVIAGIVAVAVAVPVAVHNCRLHRPSSP